MLKKGAQMPKVFFPATITGLSGTIANGVYSRSRSDKFGYMRAYVMPTATENNTLRGNIMRNLSKVWADADPDYKSDFQLYANQAKNMPIYGNDGSVRANNSFAYFVHGMQEYYYANTASVSLETITAEDIASLGTGMASVRLAIEAGMLDSIPDYSTLTNTI